MKGGVGSGHVGWGVPGREGGFRTERGLGWGECSEREGDNKKSKF